MAKSKTQNRREFRAIVKQQEVVLVAGIPGTKTPFAVRELCKGAETELCGLGGGFEKFESLIFEVSGQKQVSTLLELPKPILRDYWRKAASKLRDQVSESSSTGPGRILVPVHLVWFHPMHREYIGVFDGIDLAGEIAPHRVQHIVCLIDDIHDIYRRLREPGMLLDRQAASLSTSQANRGHALKHHIRILEWRAREIAAAEALASRLKCHFTLLATKHQRAVARMCVRQLPQVYISHAITEPRRLESSALPANQKLDRDFRQQLWDFQTILAERMALLQPTCIDEYRLAKSSDRVSLGPRFYFRERYSDSLFDAQGCCDDVIYDDAQGSNGISNTDTAIAHDLADTTKSFIENQVTARDLQLVSQSQHLIVFRPRFNGNLSGGVNKEISYFRSVGSFRGLSNKDAKIIIVDCQADREIFRTRQLLESMIDASHHDRWRNVPLDSKLIVDYLSQITPDTRNSINSISLEDPDEIRVGVDKVLRDLGLPSDRWSVGLSGTPDPLGDRHTYTDDKHRKEELLMSFAETMQPMEERPVYADTLSISADGKSVAQLANEICKALDYPKN